MNNIDKKLYAEAERQRTTAIDVMIRRGMTPTSARRLIQALEDSGIRLCQSGVVRS